jgi:hypothetical protein
LKQRSLFVHALRQFLLSLLAIRDVVLDAHGVQKITGGIMDAGRGDLGPQMTPAPFVDAFLDGIAAELAGNLALELRTIALGVLWNGLIEDSPADQFSSRVAGQLTKLLVDTRDPAVAIDFYNTCADMLIGVGQPGITRLRGIHDMKILLGSSLDIHASSQNRRADALRASKLR